MDFIQKSLNSLDDDNMLINMSKECILSANGKRMTDILVKSIPNSEVFATVLKLVKLWAKNRCIYGNQFGFLGGVSYSILVCFICNLDPSMTKASQCLYYFFQVMSEWKWPTPIVLDKIKDVTDEWPFKTLQPWNPIKN